MLNLHGLPKGSRIAPTVLGHRGSRLVVHVPVESKIDERTKLPFCSVKSVFLDPNSVFIGVGVPNVFTMLPSKEKDKWDKFSAFMFYRKESYIAKNVDRMQVGVYFDLQGLPPEAIEALREQMRLQEGRRTASCANANARVFSAAGFTCGGKSLNGIYRPSHLAALIWENGLEYKGEEVSIRIILAGREVSDHFVDVWYKEFNSLFRSVKKKFMRHNDSGKSAPKFSEQAIDGMSIDRWKENSDRASIGISRPSWFGVWLGFLLGQRSVFSAETGVPINDPALQNSLHAFPGKLDRITKLKRYVLFSQPVAWMINRHLAPKFEHYDVPRRAVIEMLRTSEGSDRFLYNIVLTRSGIRLSRLENKNGRDRKIVNWLMAKHLITAGGYGADVVFAGEAWVAREGDELILCLNNNSGTYRPDEERLKAAAAYMSSVFGVPVRIAKI